MRLQNYDKRKIGKMKVLVEFLKAQGGAEYFKGNGLQANQFVDEISTPLSHTMSYGMIRRPQSSSTWRVGQMPAGNVGSYSYSMRQSRKNLREAEDDSELEAPNLFPGSRES